MANTYILTKSDGTILTNINEGTRDNREATSLVLHGRGAPEYGLERDNNLVWMLENFADDTPPVNPVVGQLWFNTNDSNYYYCSFAGSPPTWTEIINPAAVVPPSRQVIAGAGLSGGGTLAADVTLNVGGSASIAVNANDISVNPGGVDHNSLSNYVADEHVAHSGVTVTAGSGLVGGGTIVAPGPTLNVGAGDGISVGADTVSVDSTVARLNVVQTFSAQKQFSQPIIGPAGSVAAPSFTFPGTGSNTGMYLAGLPDTLGFATDGVNRLTINGLSGVLNVGGTANYEALLINDDDVPNKKYVDDAVASVSGSSTPKIWGGVVSAAGAFIGTVPVGPGGAFTVSRFSTGRYILDPKLLHTNFSVVAMMDNVAAPFRIAVSSSAKGFGGCFINFFSATDGVYGDVQWQFILMDLNP